MSEIDPKESWRDPVTGRFKYGNKFWEARSSHGRNPIFDSPDKLLDACVQYFQWVEENPLWEAKVFCYQGETTKEVMPKMRAMTISGLCIYIGISPDTWESYHKRPDFIGIVREVSEIIRTQKFEGAAAELLNANIIARDLGLADKQERKTDHKIEIVDYSNLSSESPDEDTK